MDMGIGYLPTLTGGKRTRVVTKHFTNYGMYADRGRYVLLGWLVYESGADNSVEYSTHLLVKFSEMVKGIKKVYGKGRVTSDLKAIRQDFKSLVEDRAVLKTKDGKLFVINPMMSYNPEYVSAAQWKEVAGWWGQVYEGKMGEVEFCDRYREMVGGYMRKKIATFSRPLRNNGK